MTDFSHKVTPCLWFEGRAEEAIDFYVSLVPGSRIERIVRAPIDTPCGPAGSVLTVEFTLAGNDYLALNGGGPGFNHAVSFHIHCDAQNEVDRLWSAFLDAGGQEIACGWIRDRWGVSWQIIPRRLTELICDARTARPTMEAMMHMVKIDIAALNEAVAAA